MALNWAIAIFSMAISVVCPGGISFPISKGAPAALESVTAAGDQKFGFSGRILETRDALRHFLLRFFLTEPAVDLHELAGLGSRCAKKCEIWSSVICGRSRGLSTAVHGRQLVDRNCQHLASAPASSVIASMPTGRQRTTTPGGSANCVTTSTSTGSPSPAMVLRMYHVHRMVHGGPHEAIDEDRAAPLNLVLHRVGMRRNLDDDVEIIGEGLARGDVIDAMLFFSVSCAERFNYTVSLSLRGPRKHGAPPWSSSAVAARPIPFCKKRLDAHVGYIMRTVLISALVKQP